jgi:hypothetical protein
MNEKAACVLNKVAVMANRRKKEIFRDFNRTPKPLRHRKIEAYKSALSKKA